MSSVALAWLQPEFSPAGIALGLSLLAYLVLVEPVLGVRTYAYLRRRRGDASRALLRVYAFTLVVEGSWIVVVGLILLVSPDLDPGALGLRLPTGRLLGPAVGVTTGAVVAQIVTGVVVRARGISVPVAGDFALLLPVTPAERRLAGLVAIGAGVSEEVLVRGLLIALGVGVLGLSPLVAAAAATALFGLVHLYQGWIGVLGTTVLGAIFGGIYLATGSLLLPIVLHVAVDIRGLLLTAHPG
ncbi:MAG: CPBP family intramembrane glutamic endopeptidase, partial [Solirubrobacteraceae bacterium]